MDELRDKIILKQYAYKTEKTCLDWAERFIRFHKMRHPNEMGKMEVESFVTHLAKTGVCASTQNQGLAAILFMYRAMFERKFEGIETFCGLFMVYLTFNFFMCYVKIALEKRR